MMHVASKDHRVNVTDSNNGKYLHRRWANSKRVLTSSAPMTCKILKVAVTVELSRL